MPLPLLLFLLPLTLFQIMSCTRLAAAESPLVSSIPVAVPRPGLQYASIQGIPLVCYALAVISLCMTVITAAPKVVVWKTNTPKRIRMWQHWLDISRDLSC